MKVNLRPWITKGILTSIREKYKINSQFLKVKDQTTKEKLKPRIQNVQESSDKHY